MKEYKKNPAFGTVSVHRVQGSTRLFGSTVDHNHFISLKVHTAVQKRQLHRDQVHSDREIVEVWMSSVQFSEMLSSVGMGDGVPCTLMRYLDPETGAPVRVRPEHIPENNRVDKVLQEFTETATRISSDLRDTVSKLAEILDGGPVKKTELRDVEHDLKMAEQRLRADLPFILQSFNEKAAETIRDAKGEIEAFVANKIESTGLTTLQAAAPKVLDIGK